MLPLIGGIPTDISQAIFHCVSPSLRFFELKLAMKAILMHSLTFPQILEWRHFMKKVTLALVILALSLGLFSVVEGAGPITGLGVQPISNWVKGVPNPVIGRGGDGTWDSAKVFSPGLLIKTGDEVYLAYYTGNDGGGDRIGLATSTGGNVWSKYAGNPVLTPGDTGAWDDNAVGAPTVAFDGTTYNMWYSGHNGITLQLGLATSNDAANWSKRGDPVLWPQGDGWESSSVGNASVIWQGDVYRMWYSGFDGYVWKIGYSTSSDGENWTRFGENPVLTAGSEGTFDSNGVWLPSVSYVDGVFHMWYTGIDANNKYRIGYATSTDGVHWIKSASPVISLGSAGSFDDTNTFTPSVIFYKGSFRMLYTGVNSGDSNNIGLVTNTPPQVYPPLVAGMTYVAGFGTANSTVSIVNRTTSTTIGTGTVSAYSYYSVTVPALTAGSSIEAVIGSDHSEPQRVLSSTAKNYLPSIFMNFYGGW